jgi:hypothetical protein
MVTGVRINGSAREYNFVIDTGGLTFIDRRLADELGLKQMAMQAKVDSMDLGDFRIHKVFCLTTFDFSHFDALGTPVHGIIGSNLMERYRVTIDFDAGSITFSTDSTVLEPPFGSALLPFRNHPVNNAPVIGFEVRGDSLEGMIDTGQPYPVVFPLENYDEYDSLYVYDSIRSSGLMEEWPMTQADHNYLARFGPAEFGGKEVDTLVCLFGELPRPLSMPLIGNDLLSEFRLVIDFPRDEMLMVPAGDVHPRAACFSAGLSPDLSDDGRVMVKGVWQGSPADLAGIEVGDEVLAFNSTGIDAYNLIDLIDLLEDDAVESLTLRVSHEAEVRDVDLVKTMLPGSTSR